MRAKILTINNQKGGVGKTTAVMSISVILAQKGFKTLIIDAESQNNLTTGFLTFDQIDAQPRFFFDAINAFVTGSGSTEFPIINIRENLDLVPSSRDMAGVETVISRLPSDHLMVFRNLIKPYLDKYDYVIFDIPPTPGLVTLNTYMACDCFYIIAKLEDDSFEGAVNVLRDIDEYICPLRQCPPVFNGIFFNEYDKLPIIHRSVIKLFNDEFEYYMLPVFIRKNITVKAAKRSLMGITEYDPKSNAAKDYVELTDEIIYKTRDFAVDILNKY